MYTKTTITSNQSIQLLHQSVIDQDLEAVRRLLESGADLSAQIKEEQQTVFHLIAKETLPENFQLSLLNTLLEGLSKRECKQLLDIQDSDKQTALHYAAVHSSSKVVRTLIEYGADVAAKTEYHYTPLHFAARDGKLETVKVLVESGAPVDIRPTNLGRRECEVSPKKRALQGGHLEVAHFLVQHSEKRREKALIQANHPKIRELLAADIALNQTCCAYALVKEYYEKLLIQANKTEDTSLAVCCLKKLGDLLRKEKKYVEAVQLYNLTIALHRQLTQIHQQEHDVKWGLNRLIELEKECSNGSVDVAKNRIALQKMHQGMQLCFSEKGRATFLQKIFFVTAQSTNTSIQKCTSILNEEAKRFTGTLVEQCIEVLGIPPCNYALISLGAMSWVEMLLYGDLSFGILLDSKTEENQKYFQELTYLLQVKLFSVIKAEQLPLQEMDCGTSASKLFLSQIFSPLEENKLLNTPEDMVKGQICENSSTLVNLFQTVNFVYGSKKLVKTYRSNSEVNKRHVLFALEADLMNFALDVERVGEAKGSLYFKRELQRFLTEVIHKVCLYHEIVAKDSWERLKRLKDENIISESGYKKLSDALRHIVLLRLKRHNYVLAPHPNTQTISIEFSPDDQETLKEIFRVLSPLHKSVKAFCHKKEKERFKDIFYDRGPIPVGELYERLFDYARAEEFYREALENNDHDLEAQSALARILYKRGDYDEAIDQYHEILGGSNYLLSAIERNFSNYALGVVYHVKVEKNPNKKNCDKAIQCYSNVRAFAQERETDPMAVVLLARVKKRIGDVQKIRGKLQESCDWYEQALVTYGNVSFFYGNVLQPEWVKTQQDLAKVKMDLGDLTTALNFYEKVVDTYILPIYRYIRGDTHVEVSHVLGNVQVLWQSIHNPDDAVQHHEKILKIYRKCLDRNHPKLAMILETIGKMCSDKADNFFHEYTQNKGPRRITCEEALNKAGDFYEKAKKYYEKAEQIYRSSYGKDGSYKEKVSEMQLAKANVLEVLGDEYHKMYNTNEKLNTVAIYYKMALSICTRILGENCFERVRILEKLGDLYYFWGASGEIEEAEREEKFNQSKDWYQEELAICQALYDGPEDLRLADILRKLIDVCRLLNAPHEMKQYYEQRRLIYAQRYGESELNRGILIDTLRNLAFICKSLQEYGRVVKYYDQLISVYKEELVLYDEEAVDGRKAERVRECLKEYERLRDEVAKEL